MSSTRITGKKQNLYKGSTFLYDVTNDCLNVSWWVSLVLYARFLRGFLCGKKRKERMIAHIHRRTVFLFPLQRGKRTFLSFIIFESLLVLGLFCVLCAPATKWRPFSVQSTVYPGESFHSETASWHARTQVLIISFLFFAQQLKEIDRLVNLLLYFLFSFFCLAGYKSLYYSILDHSSRKKFSLSLYLSLCVWYFWCNGGHGSNFGCRWT